MVMELFNNIWLVFLDTAFWLLIGLLAAGFIKSFIAEDTMQRWVGGHGIGAILRAALFGAPLPLCSCGVLPAAIGLHRSGASKEATVSFLISTPETSVDSVTVTYALMGPIMAIFRPVAALVNAVGTGLLTTLVEDHKVSDSAPEKTSSPEVVAAGCCSSKKQQAETVASSCCAHEQPEKEIQQPVETVASCCSEKTAEPSCCSESKTQRQTQNKFMQVLSYAGAELLDDISKWLAIGIVLAGTDADLYSTWLAGAMGWRPDRDADHAGGWHSDVYLRSGIDTGCRRLIVSGRFSRCRSGFPAGGSGNQYRQFCFAQAGAGIESNAYVFIWPVCIQSDDGAAAGMATAYTSTGR